MAFSSRFALTARFAPRALTPFVPRPALGFTASRSLHSSPVTMSQQFPIATLNVRVRVNQCLSKLTTMKEELIPRLPPSSPTLFEAKKKKNLSFETIAQHVGRDEVAIAALFYGQAMASPEDIKKLSELLEIPHDLLEAQLSGFPNRGSTLDMPPKDPTIYRLYEIVQNYGQVGLSPTRSCCEDC